MAKAAPPASLWGLLRQLATGKSIGLISGISGLLMLCLYVGQWTWDAKGFFDRTDRRLERMETGLDQAQKQAVIDRENAKTKLEAYVDCLESERKNPRTFKCPLGAAPKMAVAPEQNVPVRKVQVKKVQETNWWTWLGGQASAGTQK